MSLQQQIEAKIKKALGLIHLEIINESSMHNVPPDSESHFKLVVVSNQFSGKTLLERHKRINAILADELKNGVHALSLQTLTPEEWEKKGGKVADSPPCLGGSKK